MRYVFSFLLVIICSIFAMIGDIIRILIAGFLWDGTLLMDYWFIDFVLNTEKFKKSK